MKDGASDEDHGDRAQRGDGDHAARATREQLHAAMAEHHAQALTASDAFPPPPPVLLYPPVRPRAALPSTTPYLVSGDAQDRVAWAGKAVPPTGPLSTAVIDEFNLPVTTWTGTPFQNQADLDFYRAMPWSAIPYAELDDIPRLPFTASANDGRVAFVDHRIREHEAARRTVTITGAAGGRVLVLRCDHPQRAVAVQFVLGTGEPIANLHEVSFSAFDAAGAAIGTTGPGVTNLFQGTGPNGAIGFRDQQARIRSVTLAWPGELFVLDVWCETFPHSAVLQREVLVPVPAVVPAAEVVDLVPLPFHCDSAVAVLRGFELESATPAGELHPRPAYVQRLAARVEATVERTTTGFRAHVHAFAELRNTPWLELGPSHAVVHYTLLAYDSRMVDLVPTTIAVDGQPIVPDPGTDDLAVYVGAAEAGVAIPEWDADSEQHRSIGAFAEIASPRDDPFFAGALLDPNAAIGTPIGLIAGVGFSRPLTDADGIDRVGVAVHSDRDSPFDGSLFMHAVFEPPPLRVIAQAIATATRVARVFWVLDSVLEGTTRDRHDVAHRLTFLTGRALSTVQRPPRMYLGEGRPSYVLQLPTPPLDMVFAGLLHVELHVEGLAQRLKVRVTADRYDGQTLDVTATTLVTGSNGTGYSRVVPALGGLLHRDRFADDWLSVELAPPLTPGFQRVAVIRNSGNSPVHIDRIQRQTTPAGGSFELFYAWVTEGRLEIAAEYELLGQRTIFLDPDEYLAISCTYDRDPGVPSTVTHQLDLTVVTSSSRQRGFVIPVRGTVLASVSLADHQQRRTRATRKTRRHRGPR